ncbi:MAG: UTP--glucose-1-phosphate uridylyltransferase [Thalassovita sp.]
MSHIRKAVFPVAGMGTRFLPATKSIPKEMLPLVDRPLIQYAVDEARAAGIEEFIFVSAPGKSALEDYFCTAAALENDLERRGKTDLLNRLATTRMAESAMTILRQDRPRGLGHAVSLARRLVGDDPFAVILPDDVIRARVPALSQMVAAHAKTGGHMVATMQVPRAQVSAYGVLDCDPSEDNLMRARGLVEKPRPDIAPSTQAVIGRYILTPDIFDRLADQGPGAGGEIQLTDAINADVERVGVSGLAFEGERYDCGSVRGYVEATVAFALDRPELAAGVTPALRSLLAPKNAAA